MVTMQWASKVGRREKKGEGSAWTLCSGLPKKGEGRRKEKVVRGHYAVGNQSREKGEGSAWVVRVGAPARRFRHASLE